MSTTKPTRYKQDAEGSPQILVKLRKMNGEDDRTIVIPGKDGKSFRIVLDDVYHEIREGETLEQAVRRQQAAWTRKVWADMPECWIDDSEPKRTEESRLIEFAKGVLGFIARDQDCGADTIGDIVELACELCLAEVVGEIDENEEFRITLETK